MPQDDLEGAALVHRFAFLGGLLQRKLKVEGLALVDLSFQIRSISSGRYFLNEAKDND